MSLSMTEYHFFTRIHRMFTLLYRLSDLSLLLSFVRLLFVVVSCHCSRPWESLACIEIASPLLGNLSLAQRLEICQEHCLLIRSQCAWCWSKDLTVTVTYVVTRFLGFRLRVSGDKGMSLSVWVSHKYSGPGFLLDLTSRWPSCLQACCCVINTDGDVPTFAGLSSRQYMSSYS